MSRDYTLNTHKAWLGLLQPVGLVVSPVALTQTQAAVDNNCVESQSILKRLLNTDTRGRLELAPIYYEKLFTDILDWRTEDLKPLPIDSDIGSIFLKEYQETLSATHAVFENKDSTIPLILIQQASEAVDFDSISEGDGWRASAQSKFERILRERTVSIGLLLNPLGIRIVYAPRGESSGYVTFPFSLMGEVQGRVVLGALKMLLGADRLFTLSPKERLPNLLLESRKYQNTVSTQLSEQVLGALYELLRGLQAASDRTNGALLREVLEDEPNRVYHGLLTVLLRNVFMLYAEDRDLIPAHPIYSGNYSIKGLFEKLRADESRYADTMDQRYGAWAQLISIYRIIYEGIEFPGFTLPSRRGHLFDPDRFLFLEGRNKFDDPVIPPLVSDGVIYRVLRNLMMLNGERISYRTLDVEQIGSVYETVMGFRLEIATGPSIAIKPKKTHGAPVVIDLEKLLCLKKSERSKWFKENAEQEISGSALAEATSIEELEAALDRKVARIATPSIVSKNSMVLQPSDERRRSGSHYTPRSLTEPIVCKALEPILAQMGIDPKPDQILALKICDPAMGSGAFLVEATRQLSEALVSSWRTHNQIPKIPADEDELLFARRLIVQRCIYGVDKNPMAVDLAKLSLWLATFAKSHAFTFLDHSLKCGDSLVGLTLEQIAKGSWTDGEDENPLFTQKVSEVVDEYIELRREISFASEDCNYEALGLLNDEAQQRIQRLRAAGDLILGAFFLGKLAKERKSNLLQVQPTLLKIFQMDIHFEYSSMLPDELRSFHWQLEYPEVFQHNCPGFDLIVGNPPFLGGRKITTAFGLKYFDWLSESYPPASNVCDLVAYFFRRGFNLLRKKGTLSFVSTNTISQGDTREGGLREILRNGGTIYSATKRLKWPGNAAVVVSLIHLIKDKDTYSLGICLDNKLVSAISSFLIPSSSEADPKPIKQSVYASLGSYIYGSGFIFDDNDTDANPTSLALQIKKDSKDQGRRILPYIGGEELNSSPTCSPRREVIFLSDLQESELTRYPELLEIVRTRVKPLRDSLGPNPVNESLKRKWWCYQAHRPGLYAALRTLKKCIVATKVSPHLSFTIVPANYIFSDRILVFASESSALFSVLQSRVHEVWVRLFASTLKDDLSYVTEDCFDTFPFPSNLPDDTILANLGQSYMDFRTSIMMANEQGLTKTYNQFHDPEEQTVNITKLRTLHNELDRAVLNAYGWHDITTKCEFLLDYEEEESEELASRKRKKPWRYRWPDAIRDEVLARLIELNAKRVDEEALAVPKESNKKRKVK